MKFLVMLTSDLFRRVLISPALKHPETRLQIVSGFATASMADRHLEYLAKRKAKTSVELIVGMTRKEGIEIAQHKALCKLAQDGAYDLDFSCRYVARGNPIHAKSYLWLNDSGPYAAFCGSANYTLTGFSRSQVEAMTPTNLTRALEFYQSALLNTVDCLDEDVPDRVALTETRRTGDRPDAVVDADTITLSLLVKSTGRTHEKAGLNWGQRPGRDRNQAYIPVPATVQNSGFFPDRKVQFTVLTDDGFSFIFVRAQANGKALETTRSNAELGQYLRKRLGLNSGEYVTRQHLTDYGRTNVTFTKIDDETYLMDFRPNLGPGEDAETWQD